MRDTAGLFAIDRDVLATVVGGSSWTRPSKQSPELLRLLNATADQVKDLARKYQSSSIDMMPMMMAMMGMKHPGSPGAAAGASPGGSPGSGSAAGAKPHQR